MSHLNAVYIQRSASDNLVIQLAPSAAHQAGAMLSLLRRYSWRQFAIVTSAIAGYREFIQAVGDAASDRYYMQPFCGLKKSMYVSQFTLSYYAILDSKF